MGFLEGRRFIIMEILAVLDVPPVKMGIMESANRSNSKEQDKSFRSESVSPLQHIVESAINGQFVMPILGIKSTMFVHSEGDTRDAVELIDYYTKGIAWGIFNVNEVREKMGMGPVDGGDTNGIMAPTGFVPLDRMQLYFQIPKQNIEDIPETAQDPSLGEPQPKRVEQLGSGVARQATKALMEKYQSAQDGFMAIASKQQPTRQDIIKAYTYFEEALGVNDRFDSAHGFLKKALSYEDELLTEGYVERARDQLASYLREREDELE
jgi:hypothetical protein